MPSPPARPFAEFSLDFVLARSVALRDDAEARVQAVESTLDALTRRWHPARRVSPARDVRMAPVTLEALTSWMEAGTSDVAGLARLGVYHSGAVADAGVPRGWIRVYLGGQRSDPDQLRASRG